MPTAITLPSPATNATPALLAPVPGHSLEQRDEYGPITGVPGGLFTAPVALAPGLAASLAAGGWVPDEHLL